MSNFIPPKKHFLHPEVDIICLVGGKCGSTTLNETFTKNGYKSIKVHSNKDFIGQFKYDGLIDLINRSSLNKKLYLFDSYRTPIERKISSFFENIHIYIPDYKNKSCEQLIDIFNTKYLNGIENYHSINSIMKKYGLEPFDTFDFKKRFIIKRKGNLIFVKVLFSDISNWNNILSEIFNRKVILHSRNISSEKIYSSVYDEFKIKYKTSKSYINNVLKNDREFRIFNTPDEQNIYINKWSRMTF